MMNLLNLEFKNKIKQGLLQYREVPIIFLNDIKKEIEIHNAALKILNSNASENDKKNKIIELLNDRVAQIHHTAMEGRIDTTFFFNMIQCGLPPSPTCPAYRNSLIPTITSYHTISSKICGARLDPSAIRYVPQEILQKIDLSGKQIDLFLTMIDTRSIGREDQRQHFNLATHYWAHNHALPGDDCKFDVNMGIFPEIGFQPHNTPGQNGSIAFNQLSPMQVHTHPQGRPPYNHDSMLYSPDNAHFERIPKSPFGVTWVVTQKDNRVSITKMFAIFDYNHPICKPLVASTRECYCLQTHIERLKGVNDAIDEMFQPLIALFEKNDPKAIETFKQLPPCFQYGIFKEAWNHFGSPMGLGDFGKDAFHCTDLLHGKYLCDNNSKTSILNNYVKELKHILVASQMDLVLNSQTLIKGDNVIKLMQCAKTFLENVDTGEALTSTFNYAFNEPLQKTMKKGMEAFETLSHEEKQAVYFAIWELSLCPKGHENFGAKTFYDNDTSVNLKVHALILAASRLSPEGDGKKHLIETNNNNNNQEVPKEKEEIDMPSISPTPFIPTTAEEIFEEITTLIFSEGFGSLSTENKAEQVNALLRLLPQKTQNRIYGNVYNFSPDPKGGDRWGEIHIVDNLDVLMNAISEELNAVLN